MKDKRILITRFILLIILLLAVPQYLQPQTSLVEEQKVFDVIKIIPAPGPACQGLTWDGQYLWVTDVINDSIYQVDTANGNIIKQFAIKLPGC